MIRRFARRRRTVMAIETRSRDTRVVKPDIRPARCHMTIFTCVRRLQMIGRLAGRRRPVMTTEAGPHY